MLPNHFEVALHGLHVFFVLTHEVKGEHSPARQGPNPRQKWGHIAKRLLYQVCLWKGSNMVYADEPLQSCDVPSEGRTMFYYGPDPLKEHGEVFRETEFNKTQ